LTDPPRRGGAPIGRAGAIRQPEAP
jgi:hypothetical protein